jgi:hypothetical protein
MIFLLNLFNVTGWHGAIAIVVSGTQIFRVAGAFAGAGL